ncbi:MAG TPA: nucleotide exchange factor GrpE [Polyangia bacterium]|nr:nucleotide exchange factor GrpE [Polyangia bacterium]
MSEDDQTTNGTATPAPEPAAAPPPGPEERIAALEAEKAEIKDRMLRIAAEFENWKKRSRKEQTDSEAKVREAVLRDMLEVIDNLDRATAATGGATDLQSVQQGIALVLRLFAQKLERYDVKPLDAKGQPFDPRLHEAISQAPSAEVAPGTVLSELQKGYKIGERLLRPAAVVVAVAPPASDTSRGTGTPSEINLDDSGKTGTET